MPERYGHGVRLTVSPETLPERYVFSHDIRVRFAETDAMGIVHHSRYLPYLEEARVAYLRHLGHPYDEMRAEGVDYAVLECQMRYIQPVHFDEVITVHLRLAAATRATFQMAYLITADATTRSTAVTVHGCVDAQGRPTRLPAWLRALANDV
jgi:acyl-CoA thioester hydrolase